MVAMLFLSKRIEFSTNQNPANPDSDNKLERCS